MLKPTHIMLVITVVACVQRATVTWPGRSIFSVIGPLGRAGVESTSAVSAVTSVRRTSTTLTPAASVSGILDLLSWSWSWHILTCHRQRSTKSSTTFASVWTRAFRPKVDILSMCRDPHDPVPDHGINRSRLLRIMMSSRLLPSLLCNNVQSGILDMDYAVYVFL